jgi:hypothetical protein
MLNFLIYCTLHWCVVLSFGGATTVLQKKRFAVMSRAKMLS